jgi:hypothetical protein
MNVYNYRYIKKKCFLEFYYCFLNELMFSLNNKQNAESLGFVEIQFKSIYNTKSGTSDKLYQKCIL